MLCEDLDWLLWEHTGTEAVCDVTTPLILWSCSLVWWAGAHGTSSTITCVWHLIYSLYVHTNPHWDYPERHRSIRLCGQSLTSRTLQWRGPAAWGRRGGNQVWTRLRCQDLKKEAQSVFLMKICGRSQKVQWDPARTLKRFLSGFGVLVQISRKLLRRFLRAQFQKPPYLTEDHPDWRICEDWETHGLQGPEGGVHLPLCNPILEGSWNIWWR